VQQVYHDLIRMLDKRRPQVLIECTIVTLDTSRDFRFGVEIGAVGGSGDSDIITFSSFGIGRSILENGSPTGRLALAPGLRGFNGALISTDVADVIVNALLTTGRARVVSAPRILVNDNATGSLLSTAEEPYTDTNVGDTVSTTSFGGYVEAGTSIELTPHISDADYLQLEYTVALNRFSGEGVDGIPPPRQTSALQSSVTIPDGSTIIIGGLNSSNTDRTVNAIPFLGQIPVLEYLFSSRSINSQKTTLFVFIRPLILRDDQFQDLKYLSEKDVRGAGLAQDVPDSEPLTIR
jgi:general secretion pathway protein D